MPTIVAIIGRPNVGKSTLFNRLTGRRLALVDDRPGVTRDRREGDARLAGLRFAVIDTAGLDEAEERYREALRLGSSGHDRRDPLLRRPVEARDTRGDDLQIRLALARLYVDQGRDRAAGRLLDEVEMADPAFPIYCNVDAAPVTTAAAARDALKRQFAGSVLWQTSVERMLLDAGVRRFVEFGPKPTLSRMAINIARGIDVDGVESVAVTTPDELQAARG